MSDSKNDKDLSHRTEPQKPNAKNRSQIPEGQSNLSNYLQRDESFEKIALGESSPPHVDSVSRGLEEWEKQWEALDSKDK